MLNRKALNPKFPSAPIINCVGSPIRVANPPILADITSVITKGNGSNFNCFANSIDTGAISKIVVTLSRKAEHRAVTTASKTTNLNGSPLTSCATLIANHWNTPVSDTK